MWKTLAVLAFAASTFLITPTEGTSPCEEPTTTSKPCSGTDGPTKPPHKCSKPNEVFDICPAPCPPRVCGVNIALILCAPAPKPGSADCKPGCRCADGYLRDKAGNCIPEKQCPIKCPRNETLDPCLSSCPPRLCGVNIAAVSCLAQNPDDCEPGCRCKDGYLRNAEGFCIHEDDCPKCTNLDEVYDVCPIPCPPRRCDVDPQVIRCAAPPKPGDPECEPGCRCADGYVRNYKGQCVTRDKCPKCTGPHQVFDPCPSTCPPQTCESIGKTYHCPKAPTKCPKGTCICEPGYYRNKIGECISEENCLKCNGSQEYFSCGVACDNVCATLKERNQTNCPIVNIVCNQKCYCEAGYARDDNNICVPFDQCKELKCRKNEIISECPPFECRPLECSQVGFPIECPEDRTKCPGKPACVCDYGYVRNSAGKCIPIKKCPSCGGDTNAISGCGVNCGTRCSNLKNKEPVACIEICYFNACDCRKGYFFDDNTKKCVLPKHCTPECGKDEVYSDCINGNCEPKSCSQLGYPIPCRKIDPSTCIKGCLCKKGYVRADNGTCIPKENCPSCGGDLNAITGCGVNCGRRCSNKGKGPAFCPAICNINGCDCRKGFVLDDSTGKCIPPNECVSCGGDDNAEPGCDKDYSRRCPGPKPDECKCYKDSCKCKDGYLYDPKVKKCVRPENCAPPCGDFEVLSPCSNGGCGPWTCSDVGFPTGCVKMDQKYCREGCICQEGYVKENGTCIPATDCPSCGGDPNSVSGCGVNCGRLCSNYNKGPVPCPRICKVNACDCKKEFVFDVNTQKCVRPKHCTPICGTDEVYSECINGGCQAKNCSQLGKPVPCIKIDPNYCIKGCLCKEGYLRADDGRCVPEDQCNQCNKPYEHYDACAPTCPPQTCESIGRQYDCPITAQYCRGACRCDKGYYRNKNGECISEKDCLKCRGLNEYFSCGGACDNVCAKLSYENQTNCPIINIKCNPMCYCEEGYARNYKNICIPIDKCPVQKCRPDERLEQCPASLCSPQTCSELGFPIPCPALSGDPNATCPGPPGCVCDNDYVRNEIGKCIPKNECPSCGGDPNAQIGCGVHCGNLCSNYKSKPRFCPLLCLFNSCDCKKGYVYDQNLKKCVLPCDCTPVCDVNEVYDTCANGGCQKRNCSQVGQFKLCLDPIKCIGGCVCQEGYLRANNGSCIPENECPGEPIEECNQPHEEYDPCPPICPPQTCESIGQKYSCPAMIPGKNCKGTCRCKKGYYRNKIGQCISEEDCPPVCGNNEIYVTCANGGCDKRNCSQVDQPDLCIDPIKCVGGCVCQKGYLRTGDGICVPEDQCPVKCTGPNEYFSCGVACDNECATLQIQNQTHCPIINKKCNPKCYCYEGYARDNNNVCIPIEQCGVICTGANEVFNSCPSTCPPQTCESLDRAYICPIEIGHEPPCKPACICKDGYFRNKIGECITQDDCLKCLGPHEYFSCRGVCDNVCETLNERNQTNCPIFSYVCNPMCYCESEYARNKSNICIPIENCPASRCGPNERYVENPSKICDPLNCTEVGFPIDCPRMKDSDCKDTPACICKEGYVRDKCGICIPISQCPSCGGDANAVSGCGTNCGRQCSDYGKEVSCILVCYQNACNCRDGFVYDDIAKKCVRYEDCTPTNTTTPPSKLNVTEARDQLDKGNIALTGELLYQLVSSKPNDNCVASGMSVVIPLAQLALFSYGTVFQQLSNVLHLDTKDKIKAVFPILTKEYKNQPNVEFEVATKCYANTPYPLSNDFVQYSDEYFDAGGQNVDFSKPVQAADTINTWVSDRTRGNIVDLVSPDMFNADTRLALVNAIYFKGNWIHQFNPNDTETKDFYKSNGDTVPVKMMYQQNSFNYAENDQYQAVQLGYKNDKFSFLVVLPKKTYSVKDTAEILKDAEAFQDMITALKYEKVQISLPKLLIRTQLDLVKILQELGVTDIFKPNNNGIEGILNKTEPLFVSSAVQQAFISVDETGTEAAAATAIVISRRNLPINPEPIYVFNANHPFLFYIMFERIVLFCGAFVK